MSVKLKMKEYLFHIYSTIEHNVEPFTKNTFEKCLFSFNSYRREEIDTVCQPQMASFEQILIHKAEFLTQKILISILRNLRSINHCYKFLERHSLSSSQSTPSFPLLRNSLLFDTVICHFRKCQ